MAIKLKFWERIKGYTDGTENKRSDKSTDQIKSPNPRNSYGVLSDEFGSLNKTKLKYYFEASRKGMDFWLSVLFKYVLRRDLHTAGVYQMRKMAVIGKYRLNNFENYIKQDDKERKQFVIENLKRVNIARYVSGAIASGIWGLTAFEVNWDTSGAKWMIDSVKRIPNELIVRDDLEDKYYFIDASEIDLFKLRSVGTAGHDRIDLSSLKLIKLPKEKLIMVFGLDGDEDNAFLNGCREALILGYVRKNYALNDWGVFIELVALPALIGKYGEFMNDTEKKKFRDAIENFGKIYRMTIPKDAEVDFLSDQQKSASGQIFRDKVDYEETKVSIRILGQNLTTQVTKEGTRAASDVHNDVRQDLIYSDMIVTEFSINELISRIEDVNFDMNGKERTVFEFPETMTLADKKTLAEIYQILGGLKLREKKENIENNLDMELEEIEGITNDMNNAQTKEDVQATMNRIVAFVQKNKVNDSIDEMLKDIIKEVKEETAE